MKVKRFFFVLLFTCCATCLKAVSHQFGLSLYSDSNVRESLENREDTYGLKLKGDWNQVWSSSQWKVNGNITTIAILDNVISEESKWMGNFDMGGRYEILSKVHLAGHTRHFYKQFLEQVRSYRWSETASSLQVFPLNSLMIELSYLSKFNTIRDDPLYSSSQAIKFHEENIQMEGEYRFSPRWSFGLIVNSGTTRYQDYEAWGVIIDSAGIGIDSLLRPLAYDQKDELVQGLIHLRYQGKIVLGFQVGYTSVKSNSILGTFDLPAVRMNLSGRWGKSNFYHFVVQGINKSYKHSALPQIPGFIDPEERVQNRAYVQLERLMSESMVGYLQVSQLQNESIFNQRYYDKTFIELGFKYDF